MLPLCTRRYGRLFVILFLLFTASCNNQKAETSITGNDKPEENRFTKVVLTEGLDEPMAMALLTDGRVLIAERKGAVKRVDTKTNSIKTIATIPVNTKYTSKEGAVTEAEEGLMGIIAHPDFNTNHWIYMYYADPNEPKHVLARWELQGDSLLASSKKVIMEVGTQRETCCHTGGGMAFDQQGNLFLTVGNNTANPASGTSSYDERPGRESWDDQRGSGNTNDLRGKILRIHPLDNGSYTIPKGNLFAEGTAKTRPEIYIMGNRNPWRVSVDSKTGWLYWGEVGPDASVDSVWGPRGYDEFNQAKKAGYFGWPYFIGDNKAYVKYNYASNTYGETFNPDHPVNNSPNNTGLRELPPAQKAFIWYPYGSSDSFPLLGSSGRSALGGPVFHQSDFKNAARPWPSYYENKWLITDFMRGWLMAVTMDKDGNYQSMEQVLPNQNFSSVIDMQFNHDGDLYFLEYGSSWFKGNANSALVRIEYNAGNRKPTVEASAAATAGAVPFNVALSSKGTSDSDPYDKDALKYEWVISGNGLNKTFNTPDANLVLDKAGQYTATLTVTDSKGDKNSKSIQLSAGNEAPSVSINILKGNKTFFFPGQPLEYEISVRDKEDGNVSDGSIKPDQVAVNFDYVPQGFDPIAIAQNHRAADERTGFSAGRYLISSNDCRSCHVLDKTSVGPSFIAISEKYKNNPAEIGRLSTKIIEGGSGVWGEHAMAAHPQVSQKDAAAMVQYIISTSQAQAVPVRALKGSFIPTVPAGENGKGGYWLRAAYTDKGASAMPALSSEQILALRSTSVDPQKAEIKKGTQLLTTPAISFSVIGDGSLLGYKDIDMTGIKQIDLTVQATPNSGALGGTIEVRLDARDGKLIGQTAMVESKPVDFARIMEMIGGKPKPGQKQKAPPAAKPGADTKKQKPAFDMDMIMKLMSTHASASLSSAEGMHTVYFVFRNKGAKSNQTLMQVMNIEFQNTVATQQ
jgi:cytochrome c